MPRTVQYNPTTQNNSAGAKKQSSEDVEETFLINLTQRIPGLVAVYNIHTGEYLYVNDSVEKILGYTSKDWMRKGLAFIAALVHPDDVEQIMKKNADALQRANSTTYRDEGNDPIVSFEYRLKHRNGSWRWLKTDGVVFRRDTAGKVECVMNISVDITERKIAEEKAAKEREAAEVALRSSEANLRATWESAADGMALSDAQGKVRMANPSYLALYGYTAADVIGKDFAMIFPQSQRAFARSQYRKFFQQEQILPGIEVVIKRKDGTERLVESRYSFIHDKGKRVAMLSTVRDITEQKQAEQSLRENEERLRLALEAGDIGVWEWDILKNTITWSDRVYTFYGADPKTFSVTYENFSKHIYPADKQMTEEAIRLAVDGSKDYDITYRIKTVGGEIRWITSRAIVLQDAKGKPLRMLGATSDTTEQKRMEQNKNDFISIATHELKTPVTSIKAYAEVLERRFKREGNRESALHMAKMDAQLDKLTVLITDLLDVTKIESGRLQMQKIKFPFGPLIEEIVEELQRTTEQHTIVINGNVNVTLIADRERVGQVVTNLLSNAIKYSPKAEKIIISLKRTENLVQVSVRDFGIGIPKEKQEKLFERFYRVSGPKDNTYPGLGLGLYISSEIIKREGGRIWVESTVGKGANFSFTLPIRSN
jgi:PAS domain S-box-containing protein